MGETGAAECGPGAGGRCLEESVCGVRCGAAAAAPVHAVFDGRVVASITAKSGSEIDCAGPLSGGKGGLEECGGAEPSCADSGSGDGAADDPSGIEAGSEEKSGSRVCDDGRLSARIGRSKSHSDRAVRGA